MKQLNMQRIVRTGDEVIVKKTNQKLKIHSIVEVGGQMSFESHLGDIVEVVVEPPGEHVQILHHSKIEFIFR